MNLLTPFLRKIKFIRYLLLLSIFTTCTLKVKHNKNNLQISQGVQGKLVIKKGEFYPDGSLGNDAAMYSEPYTLRIHEITGINQVIGNEKYISAIFSECVATLQTDEHGNFTYPLPEGKYSVFIEENEVWYAELKNENEDFFYNPFVVQANQINHIVLYLYK